MICPIQLSDRRGRTFVICCALFGLFFQDLNFLAVTHFPNRVPGGYNTLLLGSFVEGLFGGLLIVLVVERPSEADKRHRPADQRCRNPWIPRRLLYDCHSVLTLSLLALHP